MDNPSLVSAQYLSEHLDDPGVVIIDCRFALAEPELGQRQYNTSHIPGAYYLDLNQDLSRTPGQHGGRHPLPNPQGLAIKFAEMGISRQETLVVAYDDSRFAFAARLWWLLRYLGHDRVALLDGGWKEWLAQGYPVNDSLPTPTPTTFLPQIQSDKVIDIEAVKARKDLPNVALVDSRDNDRYLGKREPIDPVAGHIQGAINYPWQGVTDAQGFLKSVAEQKQRWQDIKDKEEIMVYCGSGVTACVNLFSLELAGISSGKLYSGSWSDWCSYLLPTTDA